MVKTTQTHQQDNEENNHKLPSLSLPKFEGKVDTWYTFFDSFKSLVHNNRSIDNVKKFHYLKNSLGGEASNLISSISVTEQNYDSAWNLLLERYNNKKIIINFHVNELLSQPKVRSENFSDIRSLLDNTNKHIRALRAFEIPVDHWDLILIHTITSRLDFQTKKEWDITLDSDELPTYKNLENFLEKMCYALSNEKLLETSTKHNRTKTSSAHFSADSENNKVICNFCNENHKSYRCSKIINLSPKDRYNLVKTKKLCLKCFDKNHSTMSCNSYNCKTCKQAHNSLLHFSEKTEENNITVTHSQNSKNHTVLLATAIIRVRDNFGDLHTCRALLDSGSQSNFVTCELAKKLDLKFLKSNIQIKGINNSTSDSSFRVNIKISSQLNDFEKDIDCLVLKNITSLLPSSNLNIQNWSFLRKYSLADPSFSIPGKIDLLLGAEYFDEICLNETFKFSENFPILKRTIFGWVVTGKIEIKEKNYDSQLNFSQSHMATLDLSNQLKSFWEVEEISDMLQNNLSPAETAYQNGYCRLENGRYQTSLLFDPTKASIKMGESRSFSEKIFLQMERKRKTNPEFNRLYINFMKEYENLGHMHLVPNEEEKPENEKSFYLPHHAVLKEASNTTKLRVVFNGSAKTSTGVSLNDFLLNGPVIQDDLFVHLCRFRFYPIAIVSDIEKMYRQIKINPEHQDFLRILWRYSFEDNISEYKLTTVTYGTKSASFLAIRSINQLALDNIERCPRASQVLKRDFYVDNLISGAFSVEDAKALHQELIDLTESGGFHLREWASNDPEVFNTIPESIRDKTISFSENNENFVKTLGLNWSPTSDKFYFNINFTDRIFTKRNIVSTIAMIFDPLGFISPLTIRTKIFLQLLWRSKMNWDDEIDTNLSSEWKTLKNDFAETHDLKIPRFISNCITTYEYSIHGFCDASKDAYAAVIYICSSDSHGNKATKLLCSKTKVAPLKSLTIPRLELCGALLLSKLLSKVLKILTIQLDSIHCWCDSQIVLHWIKNHSDNWKIFVSNRITQIHENLLAFEHTWHYIPTKHNPADLASRGCSLSQLINNEMWWNGPQLLQNSSDSYESFPHALNDLDIIEQRTVRAHLCTLDFDIIDRFSVFSKLVRVIVYCFRAIQLLKGQKCSEFITSLEFRTALKYLIKLHQEKHFSQDIINLKSNKPLSRKSQILTLNPFLDDENILRVGGRIYKSKENYDKCHPYLLAKNDNLTTLIIDYTHKKYCHASTQLLRTILLRNYWILGGISTIKKCIHKCLTCIKLRSHTSSQLMGALPTCRVTISRPFSRCGVDYAGPMLIHPYKGRCRKTLKSYICLFVCFTTRAIHIELVSELSSECFIAALKRFIARRGKPTDIYSDNGRNFIGSKTVLEEFRSFIRNDNTNREINSFFTNEFINWHTIPAYSPHMGGLWEAGIKSAKTHLKAVLNNRILTFEELYTLLTEIEACLNSRPLTELSSDPNDLMPLTPGHFLIGAPITAIPERNITNEKIGLVKRWNLIRYCSQQFWKRWSREYLSRLQTRNKWNRKKLNLSINDLVLIKREHLPILKWSLGRVVKLYPGTDNLVRVIDVKTQSGTLKKSIHHVIKLPFNSVEP